MKWSWLYEWVPEDTRRRKYHGRAWLDWQSNKDLYVLWPFNFMLWGLRAFWFRWRSVPMSRDYFVYKDVERESHSRGFKEGQDYGYTMAVGIANSLLQKYGLGLRTSKPAHMLVEEMYGHLQKVRVQGDAQGRYMGGFKAGYETCIVHANRLLKMTPIYFVINSAGNLVRQMDYGRVPQGISYAWLDQSLAEELQEPAEIKRLPDGESKPD